MSRLRVIVACLLVLLLPLQGFAATSLAFCAHPPATSTGQPHEHEALAASHGATHSVSLDAHDGRADFHGDSAAAHTCSACAACCHALGIAQALGAPGANAAPVLMIGAPLVRVANDPLPLPERPPRA